ncbi:hypothetical protein SAMN05428949_7398 [Chitinophaga sp. YR627]|uniref:hypothetical protein n=1 Tax=Chitinophaga sp. YR627 TaxID=1881041 RepID=UPI0008E20AB4|nr:hypothetical protein [Chitinophaga sp. YR627]SFP11644.1 hypothetical protein SAMN05428949_7398 [Chitinophaga sp. YR627]
MNINKKTVWTIAILFIFKTGYTQINNPYEQFGYTIKSNYVRTKDNAGIYVANRDTTNSNRSLLIAAKDRKIYMLDSKDSIIGYVNVPENTLAKFLSVDPLTKKYPELTPYQFASNSPIQGIDLDGMELYVSTKGQLLGSFGKSTSLRIVSDINVANHIKSVARDPSINQNPQEFDSYHTSLTVLQTTIDMLKKTASATVAEGYVSVVNGNEVTPGISQPARLQGGVMATPENINEFVYSNNNDEKNQEITIIHSHAIGAFFYNTTTQKFDLAPYHFELSKSASFKTSDGSIYNTGNIVRPSEDDVKQPLGGQNFNWVLIGNLKPNTLNTSTNTVSQGKPGAIFYQRSIANAQSFSLTERQLSTLRKNAQRYINAKEKANASNNTDSQ